MDDISVDIEKSRKEGYQNIISNRGARAARAHERKTNEKNERNENENENEKSENDVNDGKEGIKNDELETKNVLPLGPVPEGSRAKRRRENKEKKERELELYGVDGKFPVRLREGKKIEKSSVVIENKEILLEITEGVNTNKELNEFNENKEVIEGEKIM